MFCCILYHFMMFYQCNHVGNHVKMSQDSWWYVKSKYLKWWWKYDPHAFIRGCSSYTTCFRIISRVNKHVLMYIVPFYNVLSTNHVKMSQYSSRFMMIYNWICTIKILKWWWKYDPYVFSRGCLSYTTCFPIMFRVV